MNTKKIIGLLLRLVAAIILFQTLYFKFTGAPESIELFSKLGVEPWGRLGTGVIELIAGMLLIIRPTAFTGALIGIGLMLGAIASHLFVLGIETGGDGGQLFIMAWIVLFACIFVAFLYRNDVSTFTFLPANIRRLIAGE